MSIDRQDTNIHTTGEDCSFTHIPTKTGVTEAKGWRDQQEDRVAIGQLSTLLLKALPKKILEDALKKLIDTINTKANFYSVGSTLSFVITFENKIYLLNVGDSTAFLINKNAAGKITVSPLFKTLHNITPENARDLKKQGLNILERYDGSFRLDGILNMYRAIGDRKIETLQHHADLYFKEIQFRPDEENFILNACDGLTEKAPIAANTMTLDEMATIIEGKIELDAEGKIQNLAEITNILVKSALDEKHQSTDNVSVAMSPVENDKPAKYIGIFDGHGGADVAIFLAKNIHEFLIEALIIALENTLQHYKKLFEGNIKKLEILYRIIQAFQAPKGFYNLNSRDFCFTTSFQKNSNINEEIKAVCTTLENQALETLVALGEDNDNLNESSKKLFDALNNFQEMILLKDPQHHAQLSAAVNERITKTRDTIRINMKRQRDKLEKLQQIIPIHESYKELHDRIEPLFKIIDASDKRSIEESEAIDREIMRLQVDAYLDTYLNQANHEESKKGQESAFFKHNSPLENTLKMLETELRKSLEKILSPRNLMKDFNKAIYSFIGTNAQKSVDRLANRLYLLNNSPSFGEPNHQKDFFNTAFLLDQLGDAGKLKCKDLFARKNLGIKESSVLKFYEQRFQQLSRYNYLRVKK